jgi:hypothetical protein
MAVGRGQRIAVAAARLSRIAGPWTGHRAAPPGVPTRRVMSIVCSCQRSEARQTARLRRAAGARVIRERGGNVAASGYSGEARAPKSIIQEGKKGIRSLTIVFKEMQPVIGFFGEI